MGWFGFLGSNINTTIGVRRCVRVTVWMVVIPVIWLVGIAIYPSVVHGQRRALVNRMMNMKCRKGCYMGQHNRYFKYLTVCIVSEK